MNKHFFCFSIICIFISALGPPLSPAQVQNINAQNIQPPQLLTPENGSTVKGTPEFFWTSAVLPKGFKGSYNLKIVPLSPGQSPNAALAGNPPVHQATMRRTGETYGGQPLNSGQTYAWSVQVVDANGAPVGENLGMSEVYVFTFEGPEAMPAAQGLTVTTQPLVMTGMMVGSLIVDAQPLVMTGMRVQSITVNTEPLVMTGMRVQSITLNTLPLVMTGIRLNSITVQTDALKMTGMRVGSITINTDALKMTGIRDEQPKPPVESDKTPIKPKVQEELKKKLELPKRKTETDDGGTKVNQQPEVKEPKQKLDLPSKDTGTVDGAKPPAGQPDGAQMKQGGTGKAIGDTAVNKILGKVPSLKTPDVPEKPAEGAVKSTLQQKTGAKKTIGDAAKENTTAPIDPAAGTK